MPPKRKQTPRNAFFYFMQDFKSKQGSAFNSMKDVADAAGPHWNKMTKEQRKPYEEKAMMEKNNMRGGKFTSEGLDVEQLEMDEKREQMRISEMKNEINENMKIAFSTGRIQDELFFIIHINTFCYCSSQDRHYPAEISITCFSLGDGVLPQNVFHRIIKPGALPLGYASDAKLHSNETHQIKPPMSGEDENNIEEVYMEMKHFLADKMSGSQRMPILYTEEKMMKMVQHVLDNWCYDYGEENSLKVYNLQYLFRVLKNTVAADNVWPSDTFSSREIEKDVYAYAMGISCEYHEMTSVPIHCSRSVSIRYAYIICDNCCGDMNIILVPGTHLPDTAMTPAASRSSSRASSVATASSRFSALSTCDEDSDSVMSFSSKSDWEAQSVTSECSTNTLLDSEDNFPLLGPKNKKKEPSQPNTWYGLSPNEGGSQSSSVRSYAGAMGPSGLSSRPMDMPSTLAGNTEKQHPDSSNSGDFSAGRGRGRKEFTSASEFPALSGRGRGLTKRNNTK